MRIAFVGKGGNGKSTLASLFALYAKTLIRPVVVFDADINMHQSRLLGYGTIPKEKHISRPQNGKKIKDYLKGNNDSIIAHGAFRKSTPPTSKSNFIILHHPDNYLLKEFAVGSSDFSLISVGTYESEDVGTSCYHGNLAYFENILSHLIDIKGIIVADMVAGTDAFSNTLHMQFDMLVLVVEPAMRSVEVFEKYKSLSEAAGVYDNLFVVINKVRSQVDIDFINKHIPTDKILGYFNESNYIRDIDRDGSPIDLALLEEVNKQVLGSIYRKLTSLHPNFKKRYERLVEIHRSYIKKDFVTERYGDISSQIEEGFDIETIVASYK